MVTVIVIIVIVTHACWFGLGPTVATTCLQVCLACASLYHLDSYFRLYHATDLTAHCETCIYLQILISLQVQAPSQTSGVCML